MKRCLLIALLFAFSFVSKSQITWVGATGGNWNNTANWFPATIPSVTDDVVFDTPVTVNMDILSATTYTINSLRITNNSAVTLQRTQSGGGDRILQVASTNTVTQGLEIDAGSTLVIHGINTNTIGTLNYILDFGGAAGVTGEVSGELQFSGVSSLSTNHGTRLRLYTDASNNANLTVKNGGIIRYIDMTGNTTSSTTGTYLTMESGSQYIIEKNGGSFPSGGNWDANSLAKVNNLTGANGPTFNGTSYGNLEWNCPVQSAITFLSASTTFNNVDFVSTNGFAFRVRTGASAGIYTMTINGDLDISATSMVELTGNTVPSGSGGRINLKGNFNNLGDFTTGGGSGTINDFELNGTSNQNISNSGTFSGTLLLLIMNNSAGATLNDPLTLPYNLTLTSGKITTTSTDLLTMVDGATYTGGSISSFINGPMRKIGDESFTFPVGKGSIYAPLTASPGTLEAATDEFTAEYLRANPQSAIGTAKDLFLDHISYAEYWMLNRVSGSATKIVELDVHQTSFCLEENNTYVSRWNGSMWTYEPSTPSVFVPCGSYMCGTVTSNSAQNFNAGNTYFTLATDLPFSSNPLPIKLISFKAEKSGSSSAHLTWELAEFCSKDAKFEVQKSTDGRNFTSAFLVQGNELSKYYFQNDTRLGKGITYYRLKMTDADGKISYSKQAAIINDTKGLLITSVAPNPVNDNAVITLSAAKQGSANFEVYNISGNRVKSWLSGISEGSNNININMSGLPAGVYHVLAQTPDSRTVFRFVKQ